MPRRNVRARQSRANWIRSQKGPYTNHLTRAELASFLGVNRTTVTRQIKQGRIPKPCVVNSGWGLWCPDHVTEILRKRARLT